MNIPAVWVALGAVLALILGLWLILAGRSIRLRRGLGSGKTISLDRVTLTSRRLGLAGRPDRLIRQGGIIWPEEWKSSKHVRRWHQVQLGTYFLLIEDQLGIRPPHGFIVCGDGTRHQVENSDELRAVVLDLVGRIRAARANVRQPIPVQPVPGQCRSCGVRRYCDQAKV